MADRNQGWGIVRYAPGTGMVPAEDCCAFDGWYSDREDAAAIYADWCQAYPAWIVALIEGHEVRFTDRAWEGLRPSLCPLKRHP